MNCQPNIKRFTFQWHITDVCNYRCKHCYQSQYTDKGVSFQNQIVFLQKIIDFVSYLKTQHTAVHPHINFTGGEPFLRTDFLDLIEQVAAYKMFTFGILSNGYLIGKPELKRLQNLKPNFIQISLEGNKKINDSIRGKGSFDDVIRAVGKYNELNIPVIISFTANSDNYKYFPDVVSFAKKYKVSKVWTDRYLPIDKSDKLMLTTRQTRDFFKIIHKEQQKLVGTKFSSLVSSNRALQFLVTGGMPYQCVAGKSLFTIMPNGDIYPCRRLPVKVGNLFRDSFKHIYNDSPFIKQIHQTVENQSCKSCYYKNTCRGGLKCLTYAVYNNFQEKDPNCWL